MANDLQDLHFEHNLPGVESWRPPFRLPEAGNFDSLLNDAYLLHLLAIHPERILPPGKSLASAFSDVTNKEAAHGTDALEQQVSRMVKRAFWEEVRIFRRPTPMKCCLISQAFLGCQLTVFWKLRNHH